MKAMFIVNPAAGKGEALKEIPVIKSTMDKFEQWEYCIKFTERPGHAIQIAKDGADSRYDIIFAVGGDGTINEVVNGLACTESALGMLPKGSGNDFFRSLGIVGDTRSIIEDTITGIRKPVDIGIIDGRYFINISSVGFDAQVVLTTQKAKRFLSGSAAYIAGLIATIFTRKSDNIRMVIDDGEFNRKVLLTAVANGKYYGGGMKAAPSAVLDDGFFDICLIEDMPKIKMFLLFPEFIKGRHEKFREVSFYRSKKVYIECDGQLPINIDGEVFTDNKVSFEIVEKGFILAVPSYVLNDV